MYPATIHKTYRDRSISPSRSEQSLHCNERTWLWVDDLVKNAIEETNLFDLEDQFPEVDVRIIQTKNVQTLIFFQGPPFKRKHFMIKMFEELLAREIECPKYENHNTFNKIL